MNEIVRLNSYLKQDNVGPYPHTTLSFDIKFPLLRLLQILSDLKSTSLSVKKSGQNQDKCYN